MPGSKAKCRFSDCRVTKSVIGGYCRVHSAHRPKTPESSPQKVAPAPEAIKELGHNKKQVEESSVADLLKAIAALESRIANMDSKMDNFLAENT